MNPLKNTLAAVALIVLGGMYASLPANAQNATSPPADICSTKIPAITRLYFAMYYEETKGGSAKHLEGKLSELKKELEKSSASDSSICGRIFLSKDGRNQSVVNTNKVIRFIDGESMDTLISKGGKKSRQDELRRIVEQSLNYRNGSSGVYAILTLVLRPVEKTNTGAGKIEYMLQNFVIESRNHSLTVNSLQNVTNTTSCRWPHDKPSAVDCFRMIVADAAQRLATQTPPPNRVVTPPPPPPLLPSVDCAKDCAKSRATDVATIDTLKSKNLQLDQRLREVEKQREEAEKQRKEAEKQRDTEKEAALQIQGQLASRKAELESLKVEKANLQRNPNRSARAALGTLWTMTILGTGATLGLGIINIQNGQEVRVLPQKCGEFANFPCGTVTENNRFMPMFYPTLIATLSIGAASIIVNSIHCAGADNDTAGCAKWKSKGKGQ